MSLGWPAALLSASLYVLAGAAAALIVRAWTQGKRRELLAAGLSLLIALAAAEAGLRRLRPYESLCRFKWLASARYHHVNPPSRRMFSGEVEGRPVVVETNEDGLRTPHARAEFLRHAQRIAILGDSFVFGAGVNAPDAFPERLEARLRAGGAPDAAVVNAGVISYSPLLEGRQFDAVVSGYRPQLVLLFVDVTDVGDDEIYTRKAQRGSPPGTFPLEGSTSLDCHGAVHQLLKPALAWTGDRFAYPARRVMAALGRPPAPPADYYLDPVMFQGQAENRYFIYRHPLEQTRPFFEQTLRYIEAVAASAQRAGARFALVVVPRYHHWSTTECPDNWERGAYGDDEPFQYEYFRFFDGAAASVAFPVYDLLPAFRATREFPLVFHNDPHWNPRGHDFVARQIESWIRAQKLLP